LKDFPTTALAPFDIEIVSPDDFLLQTFDLGPELMIKIIKEQADALKNPPKTVEDILSSLKKTAPKFGEKITKFHSK